MKLNDIFDLEFFEERAAKSKKVVRKGRVKKKRTCPDGYRLENGKCVKQSQKEKRNRSKGAKKSNRKSKSKRQRSARKSRRVRNKKNL